MLTFLWAIIVSESGAKDVEGKGKETVARECVKVPARRQPRCPIAVPPVAKCHYAPQTAPLPGRIQFSIYDPKPILVVLAFFRV